MDMNKLIESLYQKDGSTSSLEKTAEKAMLDGLRESNQVEDNPLMDMSIEDLVKLANELDAGNDISFPGEVETTKEASEVGSEYSDEGSSEELEKVAFDILGGQVMAHSCTHEFGLMKIAMMNGNCRVCKTNKMDIEGSTICSECLSEE